jgi:hypothetical protein
VDLLTGNASHSLITFWALRYIIGHKALDPEAGIRAAVEKRRHRQTGLENGKAGDRSSHSTQLAAALTLQGCRTE